jgi:glycosyltransferase involved in cell wall biosynthesis
MRVALIHDWLNGMRGGEKVLEALLELYPSATVYTLFHERGKVSPRIESHRIVTSWLDSVPGIYRYYRNLLPIFRHAVESWDLSGFDLVISSSHAVANGVRSAGALHFSYCHTPIRYVWDAERDYRLNPLKRAALAAFRGRLRRWDCEAAARVHHFIANSRFVRERICNYYGRNADVVYPPVNTHFFTPAAVSARDDFYLAAGALVPYKRFDLAVRAFNALDRRLVIAGTGPDLKKLRELANSNIEFAGWVSDEELRRLYRTARGLIFPGREDFGIVPVESSASGCPAIAYAAGGSLETVRDGLNGIFFEDQTETDLIHAIRRFESMAWPEEQVRHQVETFSRESFKAGIWKVIGERQEAKQACRPALQTA